MTTQLENRTSEGPLAESNGRGTWSIRGLKVFRTGKMKDSRGVQRTWTGEHLDQMVHHFVFLRQANLFPHVPVRADHGVSVHNVVGYFESLRREGNFLVADVEITEQSAAEKWNRRTWRARSLEVGAYETNEEAVYWPSVMGVAFVDIGAVEGLYNRPTGTGSPPLETFSQVFVDDDKEIHMPTPEEEAATKAAADKAAADKAAADKAAADKLAADAATAQAAADQKAAADKATADAIAKAAEDKLLADAKAAQELATHRAGGVQTFRVSGADVQDPVQVQRHIDILETFQRDQIQAGRREFVEQLSKDNKIAATQKDTLTTFALSLNDEQFVQFRAGYEQAPALSLFGNQGNQSGGLPPSVGGAGNRSPEQEKEDLVDTIAMHRRTGMAEEAIKKTNSYRRLTQLDSAGYPA